MIENVPGDQHLHEACFVRDIGCLQHVVCAGGELLGFGIIQPPPEHSLQVTRQVSKDRIGAGTAIHRGEVPTDPVNTDPTREDDFSQVLRPHTDNSMRVVLLGA